MKYSFDNGMMTDESIIEKYKSLEEEYSLLNVKPPIEFYKPWTGYWIIRNTIMSDRMVTFTDILAYNELMKAELSPLESKLIVDFDRMFYRYVDV